MLLSDEGRSEYGANFAAMAFDEGEWLAGLLHSRELAACVVEVIGNGNALDYVFLAVSPAFEAATGMKDAVGRSMRSLRPDHESYWFELYARVAETGEAVAFEHTARAFDRRFHGYAFRIGVAESRHVCIEFENCLPESPEDVFLAAGGGDARLERFGATLAHELRGPLAALYNGLYIIKRSSQEHEEAR